MVFQRIPLAVQVFLWLSIAHLLCYPSFCLLTLSNPEEKRVYLRNGESSENQMICKSDGKVDYITFTYRKELSGEQMELVRKGSKPCNDDNVCIAKDSITKSGHLKLSNFSSEKQSGYYSCIISQIGPPFAAWYWIWHVFGPRKQFHNDVQTYTWRDLDCYGDCHDANPEHHFKAIKIQCGVSKYVLDEKARHTVNWYYRTGSNNDTILNTTSSYDRPFQRTANVSRLHDSVWTDLYIPHVVTASLWGGVYICAAHGVISTGKLDIRKVKVDLAIEQSTY